MRKAIAVAIVLTLVLGLSGAAQAGLITDDFNDQSFDTAKWVKSGGSGTPVETAGGELQFSGTPYRLVVSTVATFDPTVNPLTITGRVRIAAADGHFYLFTRSAGDVDTWGNGQVHNGLYVSFVNQGGGSIGLGKYQNKANTGLGSATMLNVNGEVFDFTVVDTGTTLSATFTEVGGDGTTATVSNNSFTFSPSVASNLVSFTHREGRNDYIDFVTISDAPPIPEPAGLGLIGMALLALRRRRS